MLSDLIPTALQTPDQTPGTAEGDSLQNLKGKAMGTQADQNSSQRINEHSITKDSQNGNCEKGEYHEKNEQHSIESRTNTDQFDHLRYALDEYQAMSG